MILRKVIVLLLITVSAFAIKLNSKRARIVSVIDMEMKELTRMKRVSRGDANLDLRLAELNLEKGRIIREQENENFFKLDNKEKQSVNRKRFFGESAKYYKRAQSIGLSVLKKNPNTKAKSHIYYILAFNELENVNMSKAKSLFVKSVKTARKGDIIEVKARLSLGDIYYREGDFKKSRSYYNTVINKIKDDRWYTKYLYNLSWSNYRVGRKSTAIAQMKSVHSLSKNSKYIDKKEAASRDLGFFYAESGKTKKAMAFYRKENSNPEKNFYDMGMILLGKQKYSQAASMFKSAYRGKNKTYQAKSLVQLLQIYDKYNNNREFLIYARKITGTTLNPEQKKESLFYVTKRAALLQKELQMSHNKKRPKVMQYKGRVAAELYFISQQLDPKLSEKALFYAGESYYAAKEYSKALYMYDKVITGKKTNSIYYKRSVEGMIVVLNDKKTSKKVRKKYFEKAYAAYISNEGSRKKKNKAVEKLFSFYVFEAKNSKKAETVFFEYAKRNTKSVSKNEAMIGQIVDMHKRQGTKKELMLFVQELNKQGVQLRPKFATHLNKIILATQFAEIQKANKKGDKTLALKGYLFIYKDPETSPSAKRNAAYNISVLFYELGNISLMTKWLDRSIKEMTPGELKKFYESFNQIISELYLRQRFSNGMALTEKLLNKTCRLRSTHKESLLNNYIIVGLATNKDQRAISFLNKQTKCIFMKESLLASYTNLFDHYADIGDLSSAERVFRNNIGAYTSSLYKKSEYVGRLAKISKNPSAKKRFLDELNYIYRKVRKKRSLSIDALDVIALEQVEKLNTQLESFNSIKLRFPENTFNSIMKRKFSLLDKIQNRVSGIVGMGSGEAMTKSYSVLISAYDSFSRDVAGFTPAGKSKEYMKSFKASMKNVSASLASKSRQLNGELKGLIVKNDVLSIEYASISRKGVPLPILSKPILMDKRGVK